MKSAGVRIDLNGTRRRVPNFVFPTRISFSVALCFHSFNACELVSAIERDIQNLKTLHGTYQKLQRFCRICGTYEIDAKVIPA